MKAILNNKYVFWAILTLPLIWLLIDNRVFGAKGGEFFYWTGALSGIFVLLTLCVTPLTRLYRTAPWRNWLIKRRRYLGVAAFGYLFVHTAYWLTIADFKRILRSFTEPDLIIAWVSLVVFTLLALTSNDFSIRKLGKGWKKLQNWVFLGATLGFIHWFRAVGWDKKTIAFYGGLFILLLGVRLVWRRRSVRG